MKAKKILWKLIPFMVLIVLFIICVPKSYAIDETIHAVEIQLDNPADSKPVTITVHGKHLVGLLVDDTFTGTIKINTIDATQYDLLTVQLEDQSGFGPLNYKTEDHYVFVGNIYMNKEADELIICLYKEEANGSKSWSTQDGTVIIYPETEITSEIQDRLLSF
jgi:hypothetical protein